MDTPLEMLNRMVTGVEDFIRAQTNLNRYIMRSMLWIAIFNLLVGLMVALNWFAMRRVMKMFRELLDITKILTQHVQQVGEGSLDLHDSVDSTATHGADEHTGGPRPEGERDAGVDQRDRRHEGDGGRPDDVGFDSGTGQRNTDDQGKLIHDSVLTMNDTTCPNCGSQRFELRNYSMMWHDGDIHCANCGKFIRSFDAG